MGCDFPTVITVFVKLKICLGSMLDYTIIIEFKSTKMYFLDQYFHFCDQCSRACVFSLF